MIPDKKREPGDKDRRKIAQAPVVFHAHRAYRLELYYPRRLALFSYHNSGGRVGVVRESLLYLSQQASCNGNTLDKAAIESREGVFGYDCLL